MKNAYANNTRYRLWLLLAIFLVTPLGFYAKLYSGPAEFWVNNSLGGILYEIFWCLVAGFLFIRVKPWVLASVVWGVTTVLEVFQLSEFYLLQWGRQYFLGRALLGTTFVWSDFLYYILGCLGGWALLFIFKRYSIDKGQEDI